jgi:flagellar biogenesis protein FliO
MESSVPISKLRNVQAVLARFLAALRQAIHQVKVRRHPRALRVCESLPLGDHRLLLVVQFERRRFLIGATNQSISLLDRLDDRNPVSSQPDCSTWASSSWKGPH